MTKKRPNNGGLPTQNRNNIKKYCDSRLLELLEFSGGKHLRINDGNLAVIDTWPSTGRYWIKETNYGGDTIERSGESGFMPAYMEEAFDFLDKIFYAADL